MATLHIEHPISDLPTWLRAFSGFADVRRRAGVRAERVFTPVDDDAYVYVDLDFDDVAGGGLPEVLRDEGLDLPGGLACPRGHAEGARPRVGGRRSVFATHVGSGATPRTVHGHPVPTGGWL